MRRVAGGFLAFVMLAGVASSAPKSSAKPCYKHTKATKPTKAQCLKAYKRAKLKYPPKPTWNEALARMSAYEKRALLSIGVCEMSTRPVTYRKTPTKGHPPAKSRWASLRWGLNLPRYSSAFGIWNGNGAFIRAETGYSFPGATPAEGVLGAVALARRYGFSAWACHRG